MGRSRSSVLLPILRSEAVARILARVILAPESLNMSDIAKREGLPYSVVQREVDRLEKAGVVRSQRFAQARVVRPNDTHQLYPELRALFLKTYGPEAVLAELLEGAEGIDEAFVFGSWAARYLGEWGPPPADVELLVVGDPDPRLMEDLAAEAEDRIGMPVQTVIVAPETWESDPRGFVRTVRGRPLVPISLEKP